MAFVMYMFIRVYVRDKERLYRLIKHCNKEQIKRVSEGHHRQFELS